MSIVFNVFKSGIVLNILKLCKKSSILFIFGMPPYGSRLSSAFSNAITFNDLTPPDCEFKNKYFCLYFKYLSL